MFLSTWLGFYDFEFFLCCWLTEPGVDDTWGTWLITELSTTELLIADC